jgi:ppGpp synthetase/RelA/SpoT-type nucleotidyltranferase
MITPPEVNARYSEIEPYLAPLQRYVHETISQFCQARGFAVVSRVKTLESLSEKIESGRYSRWSDIDDLVAFAIVIPTLADEEPATEFLQQRFQVVAIRRRGTSQKAPDVFRFDSSRFVGRWQAPPGSDKPRPIDQISFEVQVRSAFDHAWIVTTHALTYKSPVIDWKQQRLAAEMKATAEKLDLLIAAFQEASTRIPESPWPIIDAKKRIHRFFETAAQNGQIPVELLPKDWSRFTDNVYELGRHCGVKPTPDAVAQMISEAVRAELAELGSEKLPRSLSLWQITLASLSKAGLLRAPLTRHWPLITSEMEALYPALKDFNPRFNFGSTQ